MLNSARILVGMAFAMAGARAIGAASVPPTPESVIGFPPCSDYKLATYEKVAQYFRSLDAASDRMELREIGKTVEGRPQLLATISSEQNLRRLSRYKDISGRLALARGLTDKDARMLAREGKAVVWIDFGLHSTEVAHGQTAPLMAYKALTDESEEMRFIRDHVIFLLMPNMNPDGTTLVADWYMKHVGTAYEKSSPPELYHKYVGHDNNRDWFMFNMPESRNVARQLYGEWFPQIVYNQHQSSPFPSRIFVPPFDDPMNPNIPALVMRGISVVGDSIARRLDQEGKRGAVSRIEFDTWWNGGMRSAPYFHNMIGILTETSHASASPTTYDPGSFPKTFQNGVSTLEPSTYYPSPYRGGEWHLRDSCDLMMTASMAVLDVAAKRREEWLYDIYQMGRDAIREGASETYIVSADQWDRGTAVRMINVLRMGGIEIGQSMAPFAAGGRTYPAGSYVISGSQPFLPYLRDLLNPQVYPDRRLYPGGPPDRPYDITGWTLSQQMGVAVDKLDAPVRAPLEAVTTARGPAGRVSESAAVAYALDPRTNDVFRAVNRLLQAGDAVYRAPAAIRVDDQDWPPGTFLVTPRSGLSGRLQQIAADLGLNVGAVRQSPGELVRLRPPRVGLYHGWGGNIDEGWTRWVLEQYEFSFASVYDADIRAGGLAARFDVLVLPDATYSSMLGGVPRGSLPPEFTGGMTAPGIANLYRFVTEGGVLVALDTATDLPLTAFGLPVRNVLADLQPAEFFAPGTLLRLKVHNTEPVAWGMPAEAAAFFAQSPAFAVGRPEGRPDEPAARPEHPPGITVVAEYPNDRLVASGWLLGDHFLAGKAAIVDARVEKGRVILLGFRTQHRGQSHGTFKLLFNSMLLGSYQTATLSPTAARVPSAGVVPPAASR